MFLPYNVDVPMARWPIANWVLIALTCLISFALWGDSTFEDTTVFVQLPGEDFRAMQLVANLFAHADILHLLGNMAALFVFGNAVNAKVGQVQFVLLYLGFGVCEGVVWHLTDGGPALGASGAIMGVIGAFLVLYPRNEVSIWFWFFGAFTGTFEVSAYWVIGSYIAFDLWGFANSGESGVAYLSHLAGAAAGISAIMILLATKLVVPTRAEQTLLQILAARAAEKGPTGRAPVSRGPFPSPSGAGPRRTAGSMNGHVQAPPVPRPRPLNDDPIPLADPEPSPRRRTIRPIDPSPRVKPAQVPRPPTQGGSDPIL